MKLLIVDDEDIIREGLIRNIAWRENGFELTTPGIHGEDAIDIISKEHPDIVLADINMPYMNGLELAQWVKDHHPEIKVIFLTGYNEFQYAQKAIWLQVSGYIMKYEKPETLLKEVKRVADDLEKDRDGKRLQSQARSQIAIQTVSDLIIGIAKLRSREDVLRQLGMDWGNLVYCFAIIDVSLNTPVNEDKPNENGLYLFSYINAVREVCRTYADQVICGSYDNQIYAIFAAREDSAKRLTKRAKAAVLKTQETLFEFLKVQTKAGLSGDYQDIFQTDMAYNLAYRALQSVRSYGSRSLVCADEGISRPSGGDAIIQEIAEYIQANYTTPGLSLNDLAEAIHLSPAHLCRLIKKYENTNFMAWLTKVRIETAAALIRANDMKVYQICEMVGYNNPQYFSVVFKKYMGCSPREYK